MYNLRFSRTQTRTPQQNRKSKDSGAVSINNTLEVLIPTRLTNHLVWNLYPTTSGVTVKPRWRLWRRNKEYHISLMYSLKCWIQT
jgi:hypothetical protein